MAIFTAPRSFQYNAFAQDSLVANNAFAMAAVSPQPKHPSFANLILLVFEAVLKVVCVSLPGYIVAQQGLFDAEAQKFVANLNVMLFTPCLSMDYLSAKPSWLELTYFRSGRIRTNIADMAI